MMRRMRRRTGRKKRRMRKRERGIYIYKRISRSPPGPATHPPPFRAPAKMGPRIWVLFGVLFLRSRTPKMNPKMNP